MTRAVLLGLVLAGCARAPQAPPELVVAVPAGPSSLAPNEVNEELTLSVQSNLYETLVDLDPGLGMRPGLAESWHTPDDVTWIFRLRDGVRLQDGSALRAADVVMALDHARSHPDSRRRAQMAMIASVEASDPRTVVVRTREPFDPLPSRLSNVFIWAPGKDGRPVGTGAYRVVDWKPGGDVRFAAWPGHPGKPRIPSAVFRAVPAGADRARLLAEGQVHLVVDLPAERTADLQERPDLRVTARDGLRVLFLGLDCRDHDPRPYVGLARNPFHDVRVRRAVALAIDRQALVKGPLGGFAQVVDQIASPQELGGFESDVAGWPFDPVQARRLMEEAGHAAGFDVRLDYMTKYRGADGVQKRIVADLARIGIRVTPESGNAFDVMGRIEAGKTALYILGWISDTGDARLSYEYLLHSVGGNYGLDNGSRYASPEVDRLIEQSSRVRDRGERDAIWSDLLRRVHDDIPVIPLYRQSDLYGVAKGLAFQPRLDRRVRLVDLSWSEGRSAVIFSPSGPALAAHRLQGASPRSAEVW